MILSQKIYGRIKGRLAYNGKPTYNWILREEETNPTAITESILLTYVVDAHKDRGVMSLDVPNAYIQAEIPNKKKEKIE